MSFLSRLFGKKEAGVRTTTSNTPIRISQPVIGFYNLLGDKGNSLVDSDSKILSPIFVESKISQSAVPKCHVLLLYCDLTAEGQIIGSNHRFRDIVKEAGAYVAVIGSENDPDHCFECIEPKNDWNANIVLVLDRKGEKFGLFFQKLFEAMRSGKSMLTAWVELAPQIPGYEQPDTPESIMLPEAGHITFDGSG